MFLLNRLILITTTCVLFLMTGVGGAQSPNSSPIKKYEDVFKKIKAKEASLAKQQVILDQRAKALAIKEAELNKREMEISKRELALQKNKEKSPEKKRFPATLEGAKAFVSQFVKEGADVEKLSKQLQPTHEDYLKVFNPEFAKKAEETYTPVWNKGILVLRGKPGQTVVHVFSGTSDDLKQWKGMASQTFPGGYKDVAKEYNDGITIYCFKFLKPGERYGMAFNGLIHVNGHWRLIPKPYRIK